MPHELVEQPIRGPRAFEATGDAAAMSQAAILLLLGMRRRGDDRALRARAAAVGASQAAGRSPATGGVSFPVPRVPFTGDRVPDEEATAGLARRLRPVARAAVLTGEAPGPAAEAVRAALPGLAERLYREPTPQAAAELLRACLHHPDELPRVAAAATYFDVATGPRLPLAVLAEGTRSPDPLVRDVAATALARLDPRHPRLAALVPARPGPAPRGGPGPEGPATRPTPKGRRRKRPRPRTAAEVMAAAALLVHGTFARDAAWYQPGGDFHTYIRSTVRPNLYSQPDFFRWSGGYSDAARALAATDLRDWAEARGLAGLDLFGHSHGANVVMLATQDGLPAGELILLSCPVHVRKYYPNFELVARVVSIHVRLDLVILADRGGQSFADPRIEEHILPIWFDHQATHDPAVWETYGVPAFV